MTYFLFQWSRSSTDDLEASEALLSLQYTSSRETLGNTANNIPNGSNFYIQACDTQKLQPLDLHVDSQQRLHHAEGPQYYSNSTDNPLSSRFSGYTAQGAASISNPQFLSNTRILDSREKMLSALKQTSAPVADFAKGSAMFAGYTPQGNLPPSPPASQGRASPQLMSSDSDGEDNNEKYIRLKEVSIQNNMYSQ